MDMRDFIKQNFTE